MSVLAPALRAIRRATRSIWSLLPDPPLDDAPPPDIDGRRQSELDPETLRRFDRTRKNGKGGNR